MAFNLFVFFLFGLAAGETQLQNLTNSFPGPVLTIVGGAEATEGQFPWQLRLLRNGKFVCGAVLITSNRALTAAHCLSSGTYTAFAGEHNTLVTSGHEVRRVVSSWTKHSGFVTDDGYPNDIAILKFSYPFPYTAYIRTITLAPSTSSDFAGVTCSISGFGKLTGGGEASTTLQHVSLPVISNSACASKWFSFPATITAGHVCVFKTSKSACTGDSGGPLVCNGYLAGLASWGISSCSGSYPTVFTRISYYREWITENM